MREIQNAHHTENNRKPARHEKKQHAIQHAIQGRYENEFKHGDPPQNRVDDFIFAS
jgi:hypothetical protein